METRGGRRLTEAQRGALLGVLSALPALAILRGFTVDDALIPARYARHLAELYGYRFNRYGPSTDGVTPLGWPFVLVPFAFRGVLHALWGARVIGAGAWLVAAASLGAAVAVVPGRAGRYAALALILLSAPLGAWSIAGLETGVVIALATFSVVLPAEERFARMGAAFAGACAWLRPEMIAYASVIGLGRAQHAEGRARRALVVLLACAPWFIAALLRWWIWGRPAPLAVLSKPADLAQGLAYVAGGIALTGGPIAAFAPFALIKLPQWPRVLLLAGFIHFAAVALAGGDWMALARLLCPALPGFVLVAAHLLAAPRAQIAFTRWALACAGQIYLFAARGPAASHVLPDRLALIEAAREPLSHARCIATIDIGWVGATWDKPIVDLGGATDLDVAVLPGSHTSKAVSPALLDRHGVDTLVLELAPGADPDAPTFARVTEARLAADPAVRRAYRPTWVSPASLPVRYAIWSREPRSD